MFGKLSRLSRFLVVPAALIGLAAGTLQAQTCGEWSVVDNPTIEGAETIPIMIVPFSTDSAVGLRHLGGGLAYMLWDGTAWSVQSIDQIDGFDDGLPYEVRAVTGTAPDDLWAAGIKSVDIGYPYNSVPFVAHYDGTGWTAEEATIFEDPNPQAGDPNRSAEGAGIFVIADDDIWVMGNGDDLEQTMSNPVVCHWDGSNLEEFGPLQPVYTYTNRFEDADGAGPNDVWMVGYGRNSQEYYRILTWHWDGSQWSQVTDWTQLPGQNIVEEILYSVATPAPNDAWAVGKKLLLEGSNTHSASLYLHWDGSSWTEVQGPDIGPLTSVTHAGSNDVWASNAYGEYGGRVAHWDGTSWTEMDSAPIPDATHIGLSRVFASPFGDVWAIGYWAIYNGAGGWDVFQDIIEHFTPACAGDIDGDGTVGPQDVAMLLGSWGPCAQCLSDLNGDDTVDAGDLAMLLGNWD